MLLKKHENEKIDLKMMNSQDFNILDVIKGYHDRLELTKSTVTFYKQLT